MCQSERTSHGNTFIAAIAAVSDGIGLLKALGPPFLDFFIPIACYSIIKVPPEGIGVHGGAAISSQ